MLDEYIVNDKHTLPTSSLLFSFSYKYRQSRLRMDRLYRVGEFNIVEEEILFNALVCVKERMCTGWL